jgi:hypothetical protein
MVGLVEYQHKTNLQIVIPFNMWCDNIQIFNCFEIGLRIGMPFSLICIHFVLINGLLIKGLFIGYKIYVIGDPNNICKKSYGYLHLIHMLQKITILDWFV